MICIIRSKAEWLTSARLNLLANTCRQPNIKHLQRPYNEFVIEGKNRNMNKNKNKNRYRSRNRNFKVPRNTVPAEIYVRIATHCSVAGVVIGRPPLLTSSTYLKLCFLKKNMLFLSKCEEKNLAEQSIHIYIRRFVQIGIIGLYAIEMPAHTNSAMISPLFTLVKTAFVYFVLLMIC